MKALCVLCRCGAVQKFLGVVVDTLVMKILGSDDVFDTQT